jgi:DoxX-like family
MSAFAQDPTTQSSYAFLETSPLITGKQRWTGRVLTGLTGAFLLVDGGAKLFKPAGIVQATVQLGYPESQIVGIGIVLLACTILYLIPRTSAFGAMLLTGYLGGAVATNLRVSGPWFNILFPVFFGSLIWAGLYLRDERLRSLFAQSQPRN